jgi:hypothetical protein
LELGADDYLCGSRKDAVAQRGPDVTSGANVTAVAIICRSEIKLRSRRSHTPVSVGGNAPLAALRERFWQGHERRVN